MKTFRTVQMVEVARKEENAGSLQNVGVRSNVSGAYRSREARWCRRLRGLGIGTGCLALLMSCSDSDSDGGSDAAAGAAGTLMAGAAGMSMAGGAGMPVGQAPIDESSKLVALTFDDGPNAMLTAAVLDKLEAHEVPASFFVIGQLINAAAQPTLDRAAALGCEFENHSFGYNSLTGLTADEVRTSVADTTAAIEQAIGTAPQFFRPPNLAIDAQMYEVIDLPFAGGIVGGDFPAEFGGNPTVEAVSSTVLDNVQDGSIILLHDVQPGLDPQPTPDALDIIIPALKEDGYQFVTLRGLFAARGVDPNSQQDEIWNVVSPM